MINPVDAVKLKIEDSGYEIIKESVDDKNQSRFWHFKLEKDGKKFFSKINKFDKEFKKIQNELTVNKITVPRIQSKGVEVLEIIEDIQIQDYQKCLIYEYIDLPTISSEKNEFNDYHVSEKNTPVLFNRIDEFISSLVKINYKEFNIVPKVETEEDELIELFEHENFKKINNSELVVKELLEMTKNIDKFDFSTGDLQMQNMFWDEAKGKIYVFDLEHAGANPKHEDHAGIIFNLISVLDRIDLADKLYLKFYNKYKGKEFDTYFKYNFLVKSVWHIGHVPEEEYLRRFENGINWLLNKRT